MRSNSTSTRNCHWNRLPKETKTVSGNVNNLRTKQNKSKNLIIILCNKKIRENNISRFKFLSLGVRILREQKLWTKWIVLLRSRLLDLAKHTEVEQGSYIYWTPLLRSAEVHRAAAHLNYSSIIHNGQLLFTHLCNYNVAIGLNVPFAVRRQKEKRRLH